MDGPMSRTQAAHILDVDVNADKKTIDAAYRKIAAKTHPDAIANLPPEERATRENLFKAAGIARKLLLMPAQPERPSAAVDDPGWRTQPAPTARRTQTAPHANTADARQQPRQYRRPARQRYQAPQRQAEIPDEGELAYFEMYKGDLSDCEESADLYKRTPSTYLSIVLMIACLVAAVLACGANIGGMVDAMTRHTHPEVMPLLVVALVALLKAFTFDAVLSWRIDGRTSKSGVPSYAMDAVVCGATLFVVCPESVPYVRYLGAALALIGTAICIVGAVRAAARHGRKGRDSDGKPEKKHERKPKGERKPRKDRRHK